MALRPYVLIALAALAVFEGACSRAARGTCSLAEHVGDPTSGDAFARMAEIRTRSGRDLFVAGADAYTCSCGPGRSFGGGDEGRQHGGDSEARAYGGADEARAYGGSDEARQHGGDSEARAYGGGDEARQHGGDSEARAYGGGDEARQHGGSDEARQHGGDAEARAYGGDQSQFTCVERRWCDGYVVENAPGAMMYDGSLRTMPEGCVGTTNE